MTQKRVTPFLANFPFPPLPGYPTDSDPADWQEFKQLQGERFEAAFVKVQKDLNAHFNYTPEREEETLGFVGPPKYMNIYGKPVGTKRRRILVVFNDEMSFVRLP